MPVGPSIAELAEAVHSAMEPPLEAREICKRDAETLRHNIELFVDGIMMEDKYPLAELLNESFTMDMLDLLFKRMTAKLRMILFSRPKTHEFLRIALDPTLPRHTRALATSFIVVGNAVANTVPCRDGEHRSCLEFWDAIFGPMLREAQAAALASQATVTPTPKNPTSGKNVPAATTTPTNEPPTTTGGDDAAVAELVELIQVEINVIEKYGARSRQRSVVEQEAQKAAAASNGDEIDGGDDDDDDHRSLPDLDITEPRTPTSARTSGVDGKTTTNSPTGRSSTSSPQNRSPSLSTDQSTSNGNVLPVVGLYSEDTANFSSQLLRYFAIKGHFGACILHYLAAHPPIVELLLANIGHDDTRTLLLHLVYSDHSDAAIESLFQTKLIDQLIQLLVSFGPPRNSFVRDRVENTFLLLREIIHAPYLTGRGVAISAKTIPLDKVTGQDEYVSICGASREMANSSLRKYTSRKVRRVVHLFMQQNQVRIEQLFAQMIQELTFWSSPMAAGGAQRERRDSVATLESLESLSLVGMGHPRPVCTATLTHLFELTETVDFSEEHTKKAGPNAAAATTVGIDCLNFMCSTHLVRTGTLLVKKKLRNEIQQCCVAVNCMMGLRITSIREDQSRATPTALDAGFQHSKGNQTHITLDDIERVASSDWHKHGFVVAVKKRVRVEADVGFTAERVTTSEQYFAAASEAEKESWITLLQQVIDGDLTALEIFCSDDWRSNVREYRRLRECLITSMERKGHELMVFLKQALVLDKRRASGYHLWSIVKFLNAVLSNESKRLDQMFVSSQLLRVLMECYEKFPTMNLLLGEVTKMMIFVFGDFKNKRSRRCPIIGKLLLSQEPDAKLLPLLTKAFVGTDGGKTSPFARTDTLSELKLLMESIMLCYRDPKSRSQERVQKTLREDAKWQALIQAVEHECAKNPSRRITSVSVASQSSSPAHKSSSGAGTAGVTAVAVAAAPTQPAFQEHIINQITRPCYFSAHGFGSSFLEGDGCAFGYMFKERQGGAKWQKVLLVYEYVSYKLWYFYPSEVDETHHIQWKWIVPVGVRGRYTHGHDESHSSVGHHGLYVTAYDHHNEGGSLIHHDAPAGTRELHFSVTKLEDRDQWKDVLGKAAAQIQQLARDYLAMKAKLKKPDKKTITHCEDASCQLPFKLLRRPHACKRCGQWFCSKCSMHKLSIPEFGIMHAVRHCRACFDAAGGPEAMKEPTKLFGPVQKRDSPGGNGSVTNGSGGPKHDVAAAPAAANGKASALRVDTTTEDSEERDLKKTFSNHELYELAHGMVSPRSMLAMRRRMTRLDSIDSPTSGYKVDEVDGTVTLVGEPRKNFFGDDFEYRPDEPNELSPYGSPPPASYLLPQKEDMRG